MLSRRICAEAFPEIVEIEVDYDPRRSKSPLASRDRPASRCTGWPVLCIVHVMTATNYSISGVTDAIGRGSYS